MRNEKNEKNNKNNKKIFPKIFLAIIIFLLFQTVWGVYKENKIHFLDEGEKAEKIIENSEKEVENRQIKQNKIIQIEEEYMGFTVAAKLKIPKINLETYILEEYTEEGMKLCAAKYWGPKANEIGNFCIAGHNYNQENMFFQLIDLENGDEIYLMDNKNGEYCYEIYDIYKVKPQNIAPLSQETQGKRIITLITCVNYSKNRLIVQAVERKIL